MGDSLNNSRVNKTVKS